MRLSHSKLSLILSNPMEYFLSYKVGITPKVEKKALSIGSAVHWGIENNTEDLTGYFGDKLNYGRDQLMAEAMVHGYNHYKNKIFDELLTKKDGSKLQLIEEMHELFIDADLPSVRYGQHTFVGIVDLLLLTNEGFIIVDYKTSTNVPNWDDYLEQLYRYIFLLKSKFPELPVIKIAIINLRKTRTKQTRGESNQSFLNRLRKDYEINDDSLVNWHIFNPNDLNKTFIDLYIANLSNMADAAELIDEHNMWYVNYGATNSYGGSVYKDIIYHTPDCYVLYNIKDTIWDKYTNEIKNIRPCRPIDMLVVDYQDVLNSYSEFERLIKAEKIETVEDYQHLREFIKTHYKFDEELLNEYWDTYLYKTNRLKE